MPGAINKKVLIVTYYWPPSGGSGVQRWLKFAKYLCRQGWEPYVCTPENPSFTTRDESLLKDIPSEIEVWKLPIWEPYQLFNRLGTLFGRKEVAQTDFISAGKKTLFQRLSSWVRGNLFIPDARVFWVRPTVSFLTDMMQANDIQVVITTGPPHSLHLIGQRLKKKNPSLTWIADFRDPWSAWDLLDTLSLSTWARKQHVRLEKKVLQTADRVITIAPFHVHLFEAAGERHVDLITNGFDEDDFQGIEKTRTEIFTIRHIGVVDELRDPRPFVDALRAFTASKANARIRLEFVGNVNSAFRNWVANDPVLSKMVHFVSHMPHRQLMEVYGSTNLLLLVLAHTSIAPGNLPGKFFEYLAARTPILAIGPRDGDAAAILQETGAGKIFEREERSAMVAFLAHAYHQWEQGELPTPAGTDRYSRRKLTQQLIDLIQSTTTSV